MVGSFTTSMKIIIAVVSVLACVVCSYETTAQVFFRAFTPPVGIGTHYCTLFRAKGFLSLCFLVLIGHASAFVPTGADDLKAFSPDNMGWRSPEVQALTNAPAEKLATEIQRFREAGGKGDPVSLLNLAVLHERGIGLITNLTEAARLTQKAADLGFAPAQYQFGLYLNEGKGVAKDSKAAVSWFDKAATQHHPPAEYMLGYSYLKGEGVETNYAKANEWFGQAASHNYPAALHNLAVSYLRGRGVETNTAEALRLLRYAAELGSDRSAAAVAAVLSDETDPGSIAEAVRLARMAAEHGDTVGQRLLSKMFKFGRGVPRNLEESLRWLKAAAGRGDWDADATLGDYYKEGIGVRTNYSLALFWLEPAAKAGNAEAEDYLGRMYCDGLGVPTNHALALTLFRQSSAQGQSIGWFDLGWMYAHGLGVAQDWVQANIYYRRSAELGWPRGQLMAGICSLAGYGRPINFDEAIEWFTKAAAHGERDGIKWISSYAFAKRLSPDAGRAAVTALRQAVDEGSMEAADVLGRLYMSGIHLPSDRQKASEYLSLAATNGIPGAAAQLGFAYFNSNLGPPQLAEGWAWVQYAAERDDQVGIPMLASRYLFGDPAERNIALGTNWLWRGIQDNQPGSMTFLAELLLTDTIIPRDRPAALSLLKRSSELGHAPAQALLADQIFDQRPVLVVKEGLRCYELAAEQNWPHALARLAQFYLEGEHVARDPIRGRDYLVRACGFHDPWAEYRYGLALLRGEFGVTNAAEAANLFRSCAEQGVPAGQYAYGTLLAIGADVPGDGVEAWKWYELAAAGKVKEAQLRMDEMRKKMPEIQIAEARRRAQKFRATTTTPASYMVLPAKSESDAKQSRSR